MAARPKGRVRRPAAPIPQLMAARPYVIVRSNCGKVNSMASFGKLIALIGGVMVVFGLVVWLLSHVSGGRGALPGDIVIRRHNTTIYFPIISSIVASIILTAILWIISALRR